MPEDEKVDENTRKRRYRFFIDLELVLLHVTVLTLVALWEARPLRPGLLPYALTGLLAALLMWHLHAIPICFFYLIGRPIVMTLSPLIPSAESRAFRRPLRERPALSDDDFYA